MRPSGGRLVDSSIPSPAIMVFTGTGFLNLSVTSTLCPFGSVRTAVTEHVTSLSTGRERVGESLRFLGVAGHLRADHPDQWRPARCSRAR